MQTSEQPASAHHALTQFPQLGCSSACRRVVDLLLFQALLLSFFRCSTILLLRTVLDLERNWLSILRLPVH